MIDWVYSHPTWLWGSLMVTVVTLVSCAGLLGMQRLVGIEVRKPHNDVVGAMAAIVGVIYAVLIAFIAVATWEKFSAGDKLVDAEASLISDVYRDTTGLPAAKAAPMRDSLARYLDQVIGPEWEGQRRGRIDSGPAWRILEDVHVSIASLDPQTPGEAVLQGELLRTLNQLYDARRSRLLAAEAAIPGVVWSIIVLGSLITIGYTYLFGVQNTRMHLAMTGLVAASLSLVIVLVISLDRPFRGDLCVSTEAYENVRANVRHVAAKQ
jgi:hypothetical protein